MLQIKPLDQNVPIFHQINTDVSPVVLVNIFEVAEEDIPALLKAWEADATWMKQQPGYISTQLHRVLSATLRNPGRAGLSRAAADPRPRAGNPPAATRGSLPFGTLEIVALPG
jgi:hypothetical protein